MAANSIKSGTSDNQAIVTDEGRLLVSVDAAPVTGTFSGNTVESGTVGYSYGDVTGVAQGVTQIITSYTAGGPTRIKFVEVSGTNIAQYTVAINGQTINKKQTYYGYLDNDFQFSKGIEIGAGDVVTVTGRHNNPDVGEFSAFILVLKDY